MDGSVEKELDLINKRLQTMLDVVLEHFGESEDRFDGLEEKIESLKASLESDVDGS